MWKLVKCGYLLTHSSFIFIKKIFGLYYIKPSLKQLHSNAIFSPLSAIENPIYELLLRRDYSHRFTVSIVCHFWCWRIRMVVLTWTLLWAINAPTADTTSSHCHQFWRRSMFQHGSTNIVVVIVYLFLPSAFSQSSGLYETGVTNTGPQPCPGTE